MQDAACDVRGQNAFCPRFCSAKESFLQRSLSGERVWANFPFLHLGPFLRHYFAEKDKDPSIMGCFVVPVWRKAKWWPLVEGLQVLAQYPAGTELFTAPMPDGSRRSKGPTRWAVEVRYDPSEVMPVGGTAGSQAAHTVSQGRAPHLHGVESAGRQCTPTHPRFWRLGLVAEVGASRPPYSDSAAQPSGLGRESGGDSLPRLLYVPGRAAGSSATMFLDGGAQLDLVSLRFAQEHHLKVEAPVWEVNFADGSPAALAGVVRNVRIKMGSYEVTRDLHVMDMPGAFDVLLGKGWHDHAEPQISWRHNQVQVLQDGKYHRFGASSKPKQPASAGDLPRVAALSAKQFRTASRKGERFVGYVRATSNGKLDTASLNAVEANRASIYERVLKKHEAVFQQLPKGLPPERDVDHHIDLQPGSRPTARPPYRLSKFEEEECVAQLKKYLEMGHIQPSKSPFGAPVLFVRKPNGQFRFCVDYRALNDQTIKDRFPLPRIDDLLDRLQGATVFSKLDLAQGYHQVRIAPGDVHKTAFTTQFGHYEFRVMPFGLCNAPATFQRLMNSTLSPYMGKFCMVYLDDIIVFSKDQDSHLQHLDQVLQALEDAGLRTQTSKCAFGMTELAFLGHLVSAGQIKMDPGKVKAMTDWPVPKNVSEVKGFLGLLNYYRRFIQHFAHIALPLTELTKADVEKKTFTWTSEAQKAFEELKKQMVTGPVLQMPDLQKPFRVFTDACQFAVGATLEQKFGSDYKPVAYFSKKLNPAQRNYDTRDREALGIVLTLQEWRCYLQGSHFVVNNDHHTLQRLQSQAKLSSRNARWAEFLQEFDCVIQYVKGADNAAADAFSRRPDLFNITATALTLEPAFLEELKASYKEDQYLQQELSRAGQQNLREVDGYYTHRFGKLYLPLKWRNQFTLETHKTTYSGHLGVDRVCAKLQEDFWWPRMRQSVATALRSCHECQVVAPRTTAKYGLSHPLEIPDKPWEHLTLDLITGLPKTSAGHDSCVVFVDRLTKMVHYSPCTKTVDAPGMAKLYVRDVIMHHGWPKVVVSDRDPRFDSEFWREVLAGARTELRMSTAYHPQTDGQTERANRTLLAMLRKFANSSGTNWEDELPWLEFSYNNNLNSVTGFSPFYLCTGRNPHTPLKLLITSTAPATPDDSPAGRAFQRRLDDALAVARSNLHLAAARQKYFADRSRQPHPFKKGDEVILDSTVFHFPELSSHKLNDRWYGPLRVIAVDSATLKVRTPMDKDFHARVNVSACKLYHRPEGESPPDLPPSQIDSENWEIAAIVGHEWTKDPRRKIFRARHKLPPHNTPEHDEWFDSDHLNAPKLLREYNALLKKGVTFKDGVPSQAGQEASRGRARFAIGH